MNMKIVMEPSSEDSKSDNFKKLSVLAQILSFLQKNACILPFILLPLMFLFHTFSRRNVVNSFFKGYSYLKPIQKVS